MKYLLCFGFLSFVFHAFGQPVYPADDYAGLEASILRSEATLELDSMDFALTGENVEWDFGWLPVENQEVVIYQDPNNAGYKASWCFLNGALFNCNQAFNDHVNRATAATQFDIAGFILENPVVHYKLTENTLEEKFIGATLNLGENPIPGTIDLQDVDTIYSFPLTYGQNHHSNRVFEADLASFGFDAYYVSDSRRMSQVDGWGELTTPYGTFDETLRLRTLVQGTDSISFDTLALALDYRRVTYQWFAPGYPLPVLEFSGNILNGEEAITQVSFLDSARCLTPTALFGFLPVNPALDPSTESVTVNFSNLSIASDSVVWHFGDGSTSSESSPGHTYTCGGTREVTLFAYNTTCSPPQADSLTLALTPDASGSLATQNSVEEENRVLMATLEGVNYQWLTCAENGYEIIDGAISDTFALPVSGGQFALAIETPNGCLDTSACVFYDASVGIPRLQSGKIEVYPNPVRDEILIRNPEQLQILDVRLHTVNGLRLKEWVAEQNSDLRFPVELPQGVYLLTVRTTEGSHVQLLFSHE